MTPSEPEKRGLAISVEFLHGCYRADPSGTAITGGLREGEWPPAPARLFAALVAARGPRNDQVPTGDSQPEELLWLENQPPPIIHADPQHQCCHQPLESRYVVESQTYFAKNNKTKALQVTQEYMGRNAASIRPGVRVVPRYPTVAFFWDAEPSAQVFEALRWRCAKVGYLGTSDSPVRLRIAATVPDDAVSHAYVPSEGGELSLRVPEPGHLAQLDRVFKDWEKHGPSLSRSQYSALDTRAGYRATGSPRRQYFGAVATWLRFAARPGSISGRRATAVTAAFKAAVLRNYQDLFGEPPPVLHGHGFQNQGYELARYLALPDVGYEWSRGRLHGLALWVPPDTDPSIRARARDAASSIRTLKGRGFEIRVVVHDQEERPMAANPKRWQTRSHRWSTALPAIHERRGPLTLAEVSRWCRHAGLPEPIAFRHGRKPLVRGAIDLAPSEVNRPGRVGLPYSHVELVFSEPVAGPFAIGSGRQRGFGLCVPVTEGRRNA